VYQGLLDQDLVDIPSIYSSVPPGCADRHKALSEICLQRGMIVRSHEAE
jgi:hypothetical protein